MHRDILKRVLRLEQQTGITYEAAPLVILHCVEPNGQFGGVQCQSDSAQADGKVWRREPGETPQVFEERVKAASRIKSHESIRHLHHFCTLGVSKGDFQSC